MSVPGFKVYNTLQGVIHSAEEKEGEFKTLIADSDQAVRSLLDIREELFEQLSEEYLPKLDAKSIRATIKETQVEIVGLLQQKQNESEHLATRLAALLQSRKELHDKHERLSSELNSLSQQRDSLELKAKEILDANQSYVALRREIDKSTAQLMQNEQRVAELQQERAEKLPTYEQDSLFNYLIQRKYGSKKYKGSGITRRLDAWVAKLVRFTHHKQHYDFLRSIADLVLIEVEHRQAELGRLLDEVKELEQQAFDKIGLSSVLEHGERLGKKREQNIDELEKLDQKTRSLREELLALDSPEGPQYKKALQLVSSFLEREHLVALKQRAARTADAEDDLLVKKILDIEGQLKKHRQQLEELGKLRSTADEHLSQLNTLSSMFVRSDFDSMRSQFDLGFIPEQLFSDVASGAISADIAWQRLTQHQQFQQLTTVSSYSPLIQGDMSRTLSRELIRRLGHAAEAAADGAFSGRGGRIGGGTIFGGGGRGGGGFSSGEGF